MHKHTEIKRPSLRQAIDLQTIFSNAFETNFSEIPIKIKIKKSFMEMHLILMSAFIFWLWYPVHKAFISSLSKSLYGNVLPLTEKYLQN